MGGFLSLDELFGGRHFHPEVIILRVRWYLRFKLSYRDLVEMMAERGLAMTHTTIVRWVLMFPSLSGEGTASPGRWDIPGAWTRPK